MLEDAYAESELVIGLIGAVGTELGKVRDALENRLKIIGYDVELIRVTEHIIPLLVEPEKWDENDEFQRISSLMDAGNEARLNSGDNSILALGVASVISKGRAEGEDGKAEPRPKRAYIVSSLKHPEEVERLRAIYPQGFYLVGVHANEQRRLEYLKSDKRLSEENAKKLIERDADEHLDHGQRVTDTFHLSDFFLRIDGDEDRLKRSIWRLLALLFGHPYVTPTLDEFCMFLAFAASLRSADLSPQVGAVINVGEQVVATGANDCPKALGGQYWPATDKMPEDVGFPSDGRDFARGSDSNKVEQNRIIDDIVSRSAEHGLEAEKVRTVLEESRIRDLTEYGRVVHAEMDALLACARAGIPVSGGTLYSTTFPCHNCAKHIVAAGIERVVFIEPYVKSKAGEFHQDSICIGLSAEASEGDVERVHFEPFVGVGPRRFFDLFSLRLGSGRRLNRKNLDGAALKWRPENGTLRLQMLPASYLDLELIASNMFDKARQEEHNDHTDSDQ